LVWHRGEPLITGPDILAYADSERKRLEEYSVDVSNGRVERVSREGSPAHHIVEYAKQHGVDLIVMATHGYGPWRRFLLGSVTMKVLHDSSCPVWMHASPGRIKHDSKQQALQILCSLELADESVPVLRQTQQLAELFRGNSSDCSLRSRFGFQTVQAFSATPPFAKRLCARRNCKATAPSRNRVPCSHYRPIDIHRHRSGSSGVSGRPRRYGTGENTGIVWNTSHTRIGNHQPCFLPGNQFLLTGRGTSECRNNCASSHVEVAR